MILKRVLLPAVVIAAVGAVVYLGNRDEVGSDSAAPIQTTVHTPEQSQATPPNDAALAAPAADVPSTTDVSPTVMLAYENMPMDNTTGVFPVDARGQLVLNPQTRLSLEVVLARTDPGKLDEAKQELQQTLPPQAAAQAVELLDRYNEYQSAQKQTFPPGAAPASEDEALTQLDGLHALRVAHFGEDVAQAFFAQDEQISRQLLELMRLEKDESMTTAERAARAQEKLAATPELAELETRNRKASTQD